MKSFLSILLVLVVCTAYGQSSKKKRKRDGDTFQNSPSTVDPNFAPAEAPRHHSKRSRRGKGPTVESQKEYADRMQATVKAKRKVEKEMAKPQYADPMYFGHKRPPKKRPPGKMKFCKVCGIRH